MFFGTILYGIAVNLLKRFKSVPENKTRSILLEYYVYL